MPDTARPEPVNVEQIMEQIRARIREKRGVESSEQQVRELAAAKLEKLFEQVRRTKPPEPAPNFTFDRTSLFDSPSGLVRAIRALLRPLLRLFVNADAAADALHTQSRINARHAEIEAGRHRLYDELIHNLVIESARMSLEIRQLHMRVESLASRLEFAERRTRTIESSITYRPAADERHAPAMAPPPPPSVQPPPFVPPAAPPSMTPISSDGAAPSPGLPSQPGSPPAAPGPSGTPDGQRRRRRRRRRGRRRGGMGAPAAAPAPGGAPGAPDEAALPPGSEAPPEAADQASADAFADEGGPEDNGADQGGAGSGDPNPQDQ
jgi:hypothetical protein